jgi:TolB protein
MRSNGRGFTNLSRNAAHEKNPEWLPHGKQIVFRSNRDGNWELYTMNSDGTA